MKKTMMAQWVGAVALVAVGRLAGICAHLSAMKGGESLKVPAAAQEEGCR